MKKLKRLPPVPALPHFKKPVKMSSPSIADSEFLHTILREVRGKVRALSVTKERLSTVIVMEDHKLLMVKPYAYGQKKPTFTGFQEWKAHVEGLHGTGVASFEYFGPYPTGPQIAFTLPEGVDADTAAVRAETSARLRQSVLQMLEENVMAAEEHVTKRLAARNAAYEAATAAWGEADKARTLHQSKKLEAKSATSALTKCSTALRNARNHLEKAKAEVDSYKARMASA